MGIDVSNVKVFERPILNHEAAATLEGHKVVLREQGRSEAVIDSLARAEVERVFGESAYEELLDDTNNRLDQEIAYVEDQLSHDITPYKIQMKGLMGALGITATEALKRALNSEEKKKEIVSSVKKESGEHWDKLTEDDQKAFIGLKSHPNFKDMTAEKYYDLVYGDEEREAEAQKQRDIRNNLYQETGDSEDGSDMEG